MGPIIGRWHGLLAVAPLDYPEPVDTGEFYKNVLRPALSAVGLLAGRPVTDDTPAVWGYHCAAAEAPEGYARGLDPEGASGPRLPPTGAICDRFVIKNEVTCDFAAPARLLSFIASMHNRDT